jgi:hypothetical protein
MDLRVTARSLCPDGALRRSGDAAPVMTPRYSSKFCMRPTLPAWPRGALRVVDGKRVRDPGGATGPSRRGPKRNRRPRWAGDRRAESLVRLLPVLLDARGAQAG